MEDSDSLIKPEYEGPLKSSSLLSFVSTAMVINPQKGVLGRHRVKTVTSLTILKIYVWSLLNAEIVEVHIVLTVANALLVQLTLVRPL